MSESSRTGILPCQTCRGEGRKWRSRYGGNDPDVWDADLCQHCGGTGEQVCEDCGEHPAVAKHVDRGSVFLLCAACHKEWLEDA